MNYWVRQKNRVIGPFPKETVERWVRLNILTSLDEVSTDQRHWEVLRKSAFWNTPRPRLKQVHEMPESGVVERPQDVTNPTSMIDGDSTALSLEDCGDAFNFITEEDVRSVTYQLKTYQEEIEQKKSAAVEEVACPLSQNPLMKETSDWKVAGEASDVLEDDVEYEDAKEPVYQLKTFQEELEERKTTQKENGDTSAENFSFSKSVFGSLFSWEPPAALKDILEGRKLTTSSFDMPQAWLWGRVLFVSIGLAVLLGVMARYNGLAIPGFGLLSAFSVPVALVVLFLELDVTRSVSIWRVFCGFVVGGVFSLLVTHLVHTLPVVTQLTDLLKASVAGLTEEPAKALILLFLVNNEKRYPYVLNGVLWGAVVGAGFAAFENAGYVLYLSETYTELYWLALLRSALSPFMHIVWTASIGGALWMARGRDAFEGGKCLLSWRVLGTLAISIALHMLWNSGRGFSIVGIAFFAIAGWRMVIYFLNVGYKQLRAS